MTGCFRQKCQGLGHRNSEGDVNRVHQHLKVYTRTGRQHGCPRPQEFIRERSSAVIPVLRRVAAQGMRCWPGNGCRTSMAHSGSTDTSVHWPIMATPATPGMSSRRSTLPWHTGASPPGRLGKSCRQHLRKRIVGLEPETLPGRLGPKYEVCACERRLHTGVRQRTNLELGRD